MKKKYDGFTELGVFSIFFFLTILYLWKGIWPYPGAQTFGGGCLEYVWSGWWLKKALIEQPLDPLFCPNIYWPVGASVAFHDFSYLNTLPSIVLPTEFLLGWHNLCLLGTFVLSGYFTYRLAYEVTGSRSGAILAGLLFAFSPYRTSRLTQLNTLSQEFIPLLFLVLWRVYSGKSKGTWMEAFLGGLFLALTSLGSWYHLSILTVILVAWGVWTYRASFWLFLCRLFLFAGVLLSPFLIQIVWHTTRFDYYPHTLVRSHRFSCDLLYYFLPYQFDSWTYSKVVPKIESVIGAGWITSPERVGYFLGYVALFLVLVCLTRRRKGVWSLWVFLALVAVVLSLGPYLKIGGRDTVNIGKLFALIGFPESWRADWTPKIPLPFLLFREIPLIGGAAVPRRFAEITVLMTSLLAAEGFKVFILKFKAKPGVGMGAWIPLILIWIAFTMEQWKFIYPANPAPISRFYSEYLADQPDGAILELPIDYNNESRDYGYYQTRHGRPLFSAIIGRVPIQAHQFVKNNPLIVQLHTDLEEIASKDPRNFQSDFELIGAQGARYVVVHRSAMGEPLAEEVSDWLRNFPLEEVYCDSSLTAFRMAGPP